MSFSWRTNSWGGPVGRTTGPNVAVTATFPSGPNTYLAVSQAAAHSSFYQVPEYLTLRDLTADKSDLIMQRGGYSAEDPNTYQPSKLHCYEGKASTTYYCPQNGGNSGNQQ
jgi:hypothetical protein